MLINREQKANFVRCVDMLTRMIEKYGDSVLEELKTQQRIDVVEEMPVGEKEVFRPAQRKEHLLAFWNNIVRTKEKNAA